jgi:hypothetical protein
MWVVIYMPFNHTPPADTAQMREIGSSAIGHGRRVGKNSR